MQKPPTTQEPMQGVDPTTATNDKEGIPELTSSGKPTKTSASTIPTTQEAPPQRVDFTVQSPYRPDSVDLPFLRDGLAAALDVFPECIELIDKISQSNNSPTISIVEARLNAEALAGLDKTDLRTLASVGVLAVRRYGPGTAYQESNTPNTTSNPSASDIENAANTTTTNPSKDQNYATRIAIFGAVGCAATLGVAAVAIGTFRLWRMQRARWQHRHHLENVAARLSMFSGSDLNTEMKFNTSDPSLMRSLEGLAYVHGAELSASSRLDLGVSV